MENSASSLKLKNLEVFLIDGLVVLTTIFNDKLNIWRSIEASSIVSSTPDIPPNNISSLISIYLLVAVMTMLYAGARKSAPKNIFLQLFYAFGLIGVMLLFPGLIVMIFNSLAIGIPAMILAYIMLMKQDSFLGFANKLYDHKSRIVVLPILTSLFISGAEYLLKTRIDFQYAGLTLVMLYMPIRMLLAFKDPYKFYHFLIIMGTMVYFSIQTYKNIRNSPTTPGWENFDGYLGDRVQIVKQADDKALILIKKKYEEKMVVVSRKPDSSWELDTASTRLFDEKYHGDCAKWPE